VEGADIREGERSVSTSAGNSTSPTALGVGAAFAINGA
jgi:hypothetical protein